VDFEKAIEEVDQFQQDLWAYDEAAGKYNPYDMTGAGDRIIRRMDEARQPINARLPLIEEIAGQIDSRLPVRIRTWNNERSGDDRNAIEELAGILRGRQRRDEVMGAAGPKLAANRMHPWVWEAAARLWEGGNRRAAVQQAAAAVFDGHLPALLRLAKGAMQPLDMVNMALADTPSSGRVHLQLPGDMTSLDYRNLLKGSRHLGQSCCEMVRNLYAHDPAITGEPDEVEALEALAMLSMFARVVTSATVVP
jgi:hypothetical protein